MFLSLEIEERLRFESDLLNSGKYEVSCDISPLSFYFVSPGRGDSRSRVCFLDVGKGHVGRHPYWSAKRGSTEEGALDSRLVSAFSGDNTWNCFGVRRGEQKLNVTSES